MSRVTKIGRVKENKSRQCHATLKRELENASKCNCFLGTCDLTLKKLNTLGTAKMLREVIYI